MQSARTVGVLVVSAALVLSASTIEAASAGSSGSSASGAAVSSFDVDTAEWSATTGYDGGDQVTFGGSLWEAAWWTRGQEPGDPNGPWQEHVTTPDGQVVWTPSRSFNAGDIVVHDGIRYVAKWWTRNQLPTDSNGPWRATRGSSPSGVPTDWSSVYEYSTDDLVRHGGHLWVALWWTGHQEPGALDGPWGEIAFAPDGTVVWTPTRAFNAGDRVVYQGAEYAAKWWTRNHVPGDANGPWRATGDQAPAGASLWSADAVFRAGDVALHRERQYIATQANREAEPGDPSGPWVAIPGSVGVSAPPAIAGRVRVGRTVRARTGQWAASELKFTYRWFAGRKPLARAGHRTYTIPARVRGKRLRVVVTAHRAGDPVGAAASKAVKVRRPR